MMVVASPGCKVVLSSYLWDTLWKGGYPMCGPDRVPLRPLRLPMAPFLLENWFKYRSRVCKMLIFHRFFSFGLPKGCQKVVKHPKLHLLWFSYKVAAETSDRTSVTNLNLSTQGSRKCGSTGAALLGNGRPN